MHPTFVAYPSISLTKKASDCSDSCGQDQEKSDPSYDFPGGKVPWLVVPTPCMASRIFMRVSPRTRDVHLQ